MRSPLRWLWLLLLIPLALGLARLRFDVEVLHLLPSDVKAVQGLRFYQEHFAESDELVIFLETADPALTEAAAASLAETLREYASQIDEVHWRPLWLEYPGQSAELAAFLWFNQPPEVFGQLTHRLTASALQSQLEETKSQLATSLSPREIAQLAYDPLDLLEIPGNSAPVEAGFGQGEELFSSPDGKFRILFVKAIPDLSDYRRCMEWFQDARNVVDGWKLHNAPPDLRVGYTGRPAFVSEIAGGMERDIHRSVGGTAILISILFWWMHRRGRPLLLLLLMLGTVLLATMSLGGLIFGALNVVSAGFAAILLGLAVDYGMVLFQEHRVSPQSSPHEIRRQVGPGIAWSAATTGSAFLVLNFSGLPGLAELGTLVAIGIVIAALVMLFLFLPLILRYTRAGTPVAPPKTRPFFASPRAVWIVTILLLAIAATTLSRGWPKLDASPDSLRPRNSQAHAALEKIQARMEQTTEPLWLLVQATNESEMGARLVQAEQILKQAVTEGTIASFRLPASLWPREEFQERNRPIARNLADRRDLIRETALAAGFTPEALGLTEILLDTWEQAATSEELFWPKNELSRWILEKMISRTADGWFALGLIHPSAGETEENQRLEKLAAALDLPGFWLAGWNLLGRAVLDVVKRDLWWVLIPMMCMLILALWLAFRGFTELFLSLATLWFGAICLWTVMQWAGWSWNLINLMALPLLLGIGVDYSIHIQMSLNRLRGDIARVRQSIGRALFLCAATTATGFGSLTFSGNAGLASLGQVCAAGVAATFFTAVFLLPLWWSTLIGSGPGSRLQSSPSHPETPAPKSGENLPGNPPAEWVERSRGALDPPSQTATPSSFYRADLWQLGVFMAGHLPPRLGLSCCRTLAETYWRLHPGRRRIVNDNLLPALDGNQPAAAAASRELFRNFAQKLHHLWRYEGGEHIGQFFHGWTGWDRFQQARATGKGVLVLTTHLGNWEFGAPLLIEKGVELQVITLAEPDPKLTRMRQEARARRGIKTLVIGEDPFGFIEVIRNLEAGATVALLMDRPPPASAVSAQLFNRPFHASIAAAELARASGCILLPVYLPHTPQGYLAEVLPEIGYDRSGLTRAGRQELTREIMRAFEPVIRRYIAQWYHFVPIWPKS